MQNAIKWYQKHRIRILTLFIAFNLTAILLGSSNVIPSPKWLREIFLPYLQRTTLHQAWFLFAPEPKRSAIKYRIDITLQDDTKLSWYRPMPPQWDFFERHRAYNFQKFDLAANTLVKDEVARRDYCTYAMRLHWNEANPPKSVMLIQEKANWKEPRPDKPLNYDESKLRWFEFVLAEYKVIDGKLEKL